MPKALIVLAAALFLMGCAGTATLPPPARHQANSTPPDTDRVLSGLEVLRTEQFRQLRGKRIGLITNPTGVDTRLVSTIDILFQAPEVKLMALFGPEHGVRGDFAAGATIGGDHDAITGLPVFSLYGKSLKPTPDMLQNIDALVYDIQDIGARSYTYISTMGLAMEAAAENNIEFIVLDRPNPLGGLRVEGNIAEPGFRSFVSHFPIPYVYGLTCGELARMINGEGMLAGGVHCRLTVVPMRGWKRSMVFDETGLPWVLTSPHVPAPESPAYYVATGILGELGVISEGVGYTLPFRMFAAEWIDRVRLDSVLSAMQIDGVLFRPVVFRPFYGKHQGKTLSGVQIYLKDPSRANLMSLQFRLMEACHTVHPDRNPFVLADPARLPMFDKVVGTDEIRKRFAATLHYADIAPYLEKDVAAFRERSRPYMLYH